MKRSLFAAMLLVCPMALSSGFAAQSDQPSSRIVVSAVRVTRAPVIDGSLEDEAWRDAPAVTGFTQHDPDDGKPATENTTVRIVYDDEAIYFGALLEQRTPVDLRVGRRDSDFMSDWFIVALDPRHDRRSGADFWVNAANVQTDHSLYNDSDDDLQWDAVWSSATKILPNGWSVEMRIPFSQLRFPVKDSQVWGINFGRLVFSRNEEDRLVNTPKTESGFVSRFADLHSIDGIRSSHALEVVPYGVARGDQMNSVANDDPLNRERTHATDGGVDVKYGLTSNLTLTGTLNPDFGQVEVDPASVNLTQFELFFPEKRPFFIEGSDVFTGFGRGGSNNNFGFNFFQPSFFYSRRIGRSPQGVGMYDYDFVRAPSETTILGAAKLTGKTESGWTVGALDAVTDREEGRFALGGLRSTNVVEPMTNYFVGRSSRDLGDKGRIGVLFTAVNRRLVPELSELRKNAYTGGIDGYWTFGHRDTLVEWFLGGSHVDGSKAAIEATQKSPGHQYQRPDADYLQVNSNLTSLTGYAGRVMVAKQTGKWRYNVAAQAYSPGFESNDIGFMQRSDAIVTHAALMYRDPTVTKTLRNRSFWVARHQSWNTGGDVIDRGYNATFNVDWANYWETWVSAGNSQSPYDDRETRGGPLTRSPDRYTYDAGFETDSRKIISVVAVSLKNESSDGGYLHQTSGWLTFKPSPHLKLSVEPSYFTDVTNSQYVTTVDDPTATNTYGERYVFARLRQRGLELSTRADWSITARLSFQLYMQPFVSAGAYHNIKELDRGGTRSFAFYGVDRGSMSYADGAYVIDPDASGPASQFTVSNPDFDFRSLRGSAILRWEFRPGSALYVVWNENRADTENFGRFRASRDLSAIRQIPSDDVFLIKVSYWLPM